MKQSKCQYTLRETVNKKKKEKMQKNIEKNSKKA